MTEIEYQVIAYADSRELSVVRELVHAVHDAVSLKAELGLPLLPETRRAIDELEAMIVDLKLALLRHHPDQLELPLDLPAKEGTHEASRHRNDVASRPALVSNVLGS
jgi:hypothetical protein